MGCGCGGGSATVWKPVADQAQTNGSQDDENLTPNERIQRQVHERQARRVWPGEWRGRDHQPA